MPETPQTPGPPHCPICGGRPAPYRHDWLARCPDCGVLSSSLGVAIPSHAGGVLLDEALREAGLDGLRRRNNGRLLARLKSLLGTRRRLLDVGSGPGFLLGRARALGFEAEGVEPDGNTIAAARTRGAVVRHGFFPAVLAADERFDAIVFNDALEHMPDLDGALDAAARHLAPGGVLCLNCPDRRGLYFRAADLLDRLGVAGPYDRLWQKGLPSPHVWYFTLADLERAAGKRGLQAAGRDRLDTVDLAGLWARIRYVRGQPLWLSAAAYAFALLSWPIARLAPPDTVACFFRKPG
jgi:SAM-dependent methyltransferase